jgi:hypothetical protein
MVLLFSMQTNELVQTDNRMAKREKHIVLGLLELYQ